MIKMMMLIIVYAIEMITSKILKNLMIEKW